LGHIDKFIYMLNSVVNQWLFGSLLRAGRSLKARMGEGLLLLRLGRKKASKTFILSEVYVESLGQRNFTVAGHGEDPDTVRQV